ncbi:potassium/proton antiporter [Aedoeadaptatus coxii]|uniref:Potassium/proton antiporter n=2 Tax=Aedoeadaptatus coxii TaxID=755172 RepID=A0A134AI24_9FIRM|nr:potassium/proton antiporter [Peptoniphilus coxii]KXB67356.1 potassium/proton antiporter [Peptoniphilus coxii]
MNEILLFIAVSFILALFAIRFSHRYGIPSLLLFFLLGIGAGYLIDFQNFDFMERYSSFALFIIMFYGGYGTKLAMGLPVLKPAVLLSSLGVVITALVTGLFAHYALGFSMVESMLFGSVIGSTDYASVSSVLQSKNLNLKNHSAPLLELESGSNDPTAYTMTMIFLSILLGWSMSIPLLVVQQIGLALLFGYVMTRIFFIIIERVNFQKEGLFTIFVFTMALGTYALTGVLNGNGYLAVYLFGILIGNREYMGKREVVFFFDGLTEIMQISLFFLIGFLSDITKLIQWLPLGVVVTVFMLFVARPITIFGVMPFFKSTFKQNIVLCWSGLRGAAAIAFAIMVVNSGAPLEGDIFHAVFAVCIVSSLIQGSLLPWVVKKTDMLNPDDTVLKTFNYYQDRSAIGFLETKVLDKELIGLPVKDLNLTFDFIVAKLVRDGKTIVPHGETILEEGDMVVIGGKSHFDEVGRNLQEFTIREHHPWANKRIMDLDLKPSELILMVERDNHILVPSGETMVYVGDKIVYTEDREDLFNHRSAKKKALFNR